MRPITAQPFFQRSWMITLLIGLAVLSLDYALWRVLKDAGVTRSHAWLDLALLLCGYLLLFCLRPIHKLVHRRLCRSHARQSLRDR
ncbi:hypothetical protein PFWH6_3881 [Pseudomonas fluorescens WH6]|nr:hypothetical protein PFWH6_3881 [Pseudomonas fluorescens WH6]